MRRVPDSDRVILPEDFSAGWERYPVDHLHEGGFSGPILTQNGVDFAGLNLQINRVICNDRRVDLG